MGRPSARSGDAHQGSGASILTRSRPGAVSEDVAKLLEPQKVRKYHNQPVEADGYRFDSRREAERYQLLAAMQRSGEIRDLEVHPRFPLVVHDIDCGVYVADFAYLDRWTERRVIEDVKSPATRKLPTYRLKIRLVWALYGLRVEEA